MPDKIYDVDLRAIQRSQVHLFKNLKRINIVKEQEKLSKTN